LRVEALKLMPISSKESGQVPAVVDGEHKNFGDFLTEALGEVNTLQQNASQASFDLAAGKLQDVSQVTIATEKANIALQLTMQVRNKMIDAYQEVMRMQV